MHDSFTPLGGLVPMWLMQLGEVVFGGVGSGLYGMLVFAIIAVFIAGLMVGRTPEYLGKKIEAYEMKMAALVILIPPFVVLVGTALAVRHRARAPRACRTPARTASRRCCTRSPRPATTTAARSPASRPTRLSTTPRSASRCGCRATGWSCRCWRSPARWRPRSSCRPRAARCRRTRRCSSRCSSARCCWSAR